METLRRKFAVLTGASRAITPVWRQAARAVGLRDEAATIKVAAFALSRTGTLDIPINDAGPTKHGPSPGPPNADWQGGCALKSFGAVRPTRAAGSSAGLPALTPGRHSFCTPAWNTTPPICVLSSRLGG